MVRKLLNVTGLLLAPFLQLMAQSQYELNSGWECANVSDVTVKGEALSAPTYGLKGWLPATVPGTVLTTLLNNKLVPDPFYGMNNERIPDIYTTGRDHYTYWFVKDFSEATPAADGQVWLHFRGVNDGCDIYLNGHRLNATTHYGTYLRHSYNITSFLAKDGKNRLAVIVYPPVIVGNPNGGQGGDGVIAKNVGPQYTAGWDWIQPMRDRNTGIWDKVTIEKTGAVNISNPHVVTLVPGPRWPEAKQAPATIRVSAELDNATAKSIAGTLRYTIGGVTVSSKVTLAPKAHTEVQLPDLELKDPKLWWPSGYGPQNLYQSKVEFVENNKVDDTEEISVGVREIRTFWNAHTRSRELSVNGQNIFVKGGNWITSDAMFRFTDERYDAEIRFHRDMNLNLIRIWGGSLTERPEFFKACDKYGMLVFQDFWMSGDCNGRWVDPMKKEDQWTRRQYPDDHRLWINSAADQVKLLRNHASLAFWCGGNEITPPTDIFDVLADSIMPKLDGTRYFFHYSNTDSMSYNMLGGNGDGPYNWQPLNVFWNERTWPFNSEVGSVGVGDLESLERFIPKENLVGPENKPGGVDSVWDYHKYIPYFNSLDVYGKPKDIRDWTNKAQLVNYDQYRGLMEGFSSHMWDWYTGVIIWKTQNPWTALRGQHYDYYLDPNACLYGNRTGAAPVHGMINPTDGTVFIVNNTFSYYHDIMLQLKAYDMKGHDTLITQVFCEIGPSNVQKIMNVKNFLDKLAEKEGVFLAVRLIKADKTVMDDNLYWFPDAKGNYSGLQNMQAAKPQITATKSGNEIHVKISNPKGGPLAFFNRVSLINPQTKKRILPVFYNDNYVSVVPGEEKVVIISGDAIAKAGKTQVTVSGWNLAEQVIEIK
ncbi:glycoside hydrolase family 2 protein [Chitinophaga sancti]|uniref:Glycoside hydrolase family 2 TIM barrel-domain containing protein n=1 Tax=Chitinophaga sancti TaxID=1004 RepID=A0A1K1LMG0_9BACT|nr:glycoside hydrolase family 2 TIM barrel-domain containing protein [Chitinophaga sancti]WQD65020.1 glycoside hydrolase family 2 TIM barrel-domain containing protein [Chitinophaga sancti]WQG89356.1 glycoside hydrolase family 2 TIM barrel-domain containing protein [Chitinophaga sancti]SFW12081.1 Glycosyl hydrolases family 2, TIM barrel domain [Chitinophaga sancti]